jgi:hypothetical protein
MRWKSLRILPADQEVACNRMNIHANELVQTIDESTKAFEISGLSREDQDALLGLCYGLTPEVVGL